MSNAKLLSYRQGLLARSVYQMFVLEDLSFFGSDFSLAVCDFVQFAAEVSFEIWVHVLNLFVKAMKASYWVYDCCIRAVHCL